MPAKGRRVAVRQAELRSRRRRPGPGATIPEAGVATQDRASAAAPGQPGDSPVAPAAPAMPARASGLAQRRGAGRLRGDQVSAYSYVGAEMRRIFIVMGVVAVILAVLTFLLK